MNLLLLVDEDFLPDGTVRLCGRRRDHAREVLQATAGDTLKVGRLHGEVGTAEVLHAGPDELRLRPQLNAPPPARPGIDVLLAVPRPKALKKVLPALASLGVDRVVLVNAARVEKSYFDAHVLAPEEVATLFHQGLEQARDTRPPELRLERRFRPFVEDALDETFGTAAERLLLHPGAPAPLRPSAGGGRTVLAIGPEGGWVPFERALLTAHGFSPVGLGERPYRVEVVVPYAVGRLHPG